MIDPDSGNFIAYEDWSPNKDTVDIIAKCNTIIQEKSGFILSVRQIFYQGVAKDWWANRDSMYQRLIGILRNARMAGMVSWDAIEDRGRALMGHRTFEHPGQAFAALADANYRDPWTYRMDLWANQDWRPEVWYEKAAVEGIVDQICSELRVDHFATRGHSSVSETWRAGQRFADYIKRGQRPVIFYLGDRDPTGMHIPEHIEETLHKFVGQPIMVQRIALNQDQIDKYDMPPNPVKIRADGEYADSRAKVYVDQFGEVSYELDALDPEVMQELIASAIRPFRDPERWDEMQSEETNDKRVIQELIDEAQARRQGDVED